MLLEKAYAKLHGNYYTLRGGFANEGMIDLTGCPSYNLNFEDAKVKEMVTSGELFEKIVHYDKLGYMLSASTPGEDRWTETGGPNEAGGLVPGHAYTIIGAKEALGARLLLIRNPWGQFEWDGDWGDESPLWTDEMVKAFDAKFDAKDGTFWMCFDDFIKHFRSVNICRVSRWNEIRIKGKFVNTVGFMDPTDVKAISRWYYHINIGLRQRAFIGVHQVDERIEGYAKTLPYLDIGIAILKKNETGNWTLYQNATLVRDRQCEVEIDFSPGEYLIVPRTTGSGMRRKEAEKAVPLTSNGNLSQHFISCIMDIFGKFDLTLNRSMDFGEFKQLQSTIGNAGIEED